MKQNYDLVMEKQIAERGDRNKLLLHACCAPCTSGCIDRLTPHFDVTVYFYNPNISSQKEYDNLINLLIEKTEKGDVQF